MPKRRKKPAAADPTTANSRSIPATSVEPVTPAFPPEKLDAVILLAIAGISDTTLLNACLKLGLTRPESEAAIVEAKSRIVAAATRSQDEVRGQAVTRLNDLYRRAIESQTPKQALAIQKELNRIWRLHESKTEPAEPGASATGGSPESFELQRIAAHLHPLELCPPTDPLSEHARLAAALINTSMI